MRVFLPNERLLAGTTIVVLAAGGFVNLLGRYADQVGLRGGRTRHDEPARRR